MVTNSNEQGVSRLMWFALLIATAVLLQVAAGYFPGFGHVLSIFGTVPVLLAGLYGMVPGFAVYTVAGVLILAIQPREAPVFLLTTGLLGLALGFTCGRRFTPAGRIFYPAAVLAVGITMLTYGAGMPAFGRLTSCTQPGLNILFFALFSVVYSFLWSLLIPALKRIPLKVPQAFYMRIDPPENRQ